MLRASNARGRETGVGMATAAEMAKMAGNTGALCRRSGTYKCVVCERTVWVHRGDKLPHCTMDGEAFWVLAQIPGGAGRGILMAAVS